MTADVLGLKRTPFAFGLSFVPAEALDPLSRTDVEPADALVHACLELEADFAFVSCCEPWSAAAVGALLEHGVAPLWAVDGPLWPVIQDYGVTAGLKATVTHPDEIAERIDHRLELMMEQVRMGIGLGAKAIVIAEDLAGNEGPLVAPDFAISTLLPRLADPVGIAMEAGTPCILHSDGDIRMLLAAVARAGFAGVHAGGGLDFDGFERLFLAARSAGLVVIGGLQTQGLSAGFPAATALGSRAGVLAQAGGLLLADDGGLTRPLQVATLVAALMAARDT